VIGTAAARGGERAPPGRLPAVATVRALTWNLFHCRDGAPAPRATWRSRLLGLAEDDGVRLHLNRKLTAPIGAVLRAAGPDIAALQEVPPDAVPELCAATGMRAVGVRTGPRLGPVDVRGRLGRRNPDLWQSYEGNANVILVAPAWEVVPGSVRSLRLSPPATILATARRERIGALQALRWALEPRRLVLARARAPGGAEVAVACLHCQNGPPAVVAAELERAAAFLAQAAPPPLPLIVAGDLNSRLDDPRVVGVLERAGLAGARGGGAADRPLGVDHILHRGLEVVAPPRRWAEAEREVTVPWRGGRRLVRLSDHDPVEAVYRLPERVTGS
jgi:hypothetical protein